MKTCCLALILIACCLGPAAQGALIAHWPLDSDASDATGNGHNGTVLGNTVTFGQQGANLSTGNAASFTGNGHIDVPYDPALNPGSEGADLSGSFTVALWAKPTAVTGAHRSPFTSRNDAGTSVNGPIIYIEPGGSWTYWAGNNGPSGAWNPINTDLAVADAWVHVAIVYDSATVTRKMYLDGVEVINQPGGVSANQVKDLHIGAGQDDGNNFNFAGLIDDVGFWDNALTEAEIQDVMANGVDTGPIVPDPRLRVNSPITLPLNGAIQQFDIVITNAGLTKPLNITGTSFTGPNAANFSVVTTPGPIAPAGTGVLKISFNPLAAAGVIDAILQITSNDPADPTRSVMLHGTIHDPHLVAGAELDFGNMPAGSGPKQMLFPIQNTGGAKILHLDAVNVLGPLATNFTVNSFPATLAAGATGNITVTFDRMGGDGSFSAQLEIQSDDPLNATMTIPVKAEVAFVNPLVAWWPLDTDASDASGNGFDGTVIDPVTFGEAGANAATGSSALFEGTGHIDIAYDPRLNPGIKAPAGAASFTVTLWAYPTAVADGAHHSPYTSREDNAANVNGPIIYLEPGGLWTYWAGNNGPSGAWNPINTNPAAAETWTHVAISYDAATTTRKMFLDGVEVANVVQGVSANSVRDTHIGGGADDGNSFTWAGRIDDVGLFRKALTLAEIQQVMTGGVGSLVSGPTPGFAITTITRGPVAGQVTLTWTSTPGADYRVQRSTNLVTWSDLNPPVPSGGSTTSFTDTTLPANTLDIFYRVRAL